MYSVTLRAISYTHVGQWLEKCMFPVFVKCETGWYSSGAVNLYLWCIWCERWPCYLLFWHHRFSQSLHLNIRAVLFNKSWLFLRNSFKTCSHRLWRVPVSCLTSVCPVIHPSLNVSAQLPLNRFLWNLILETLLKSLEEVHMGLKSDKMSATSREDLGAFYFFNRNSGRSTALKTTMPKRICFVTMVAHLFVSSDV
jgi:hypothetical protein